MGPQEQPEIGAEVGSLPSPQSTKTESPAAGFCRPPDTSTGTPHFGVATNGLIVIPALVRFRLLCIRISVFVVVSCQVTCRFPAFENAICGKIEFPILLLKFNGQLKWEPPLELAANQTSESVKLAGVSCHTAYTLLMPPRAN